jgi:hypothetical protein
MKNYQFSFITTMFNLLFWEITNNIFFGIFVLVFAVLTLIELFTKPVGTDIEINSH